MENIKQYSGFPAMAQDKSMAEFTGKVIVIVTAPEGFNLMGVKATFFVYNYLNGVAQSFKFAYFFDPTATKFSNWDYPYA